MTPPHIAIIHTHSISEEVFTEFMQTVTANELSIKVDSREDSGVYAAIEWLIPTAVIVYISKSYFDGFLKEMGKDHYNLLKSGLKSLREKLLGPSSPNITVIGTVGKITKDQPYSLVYSILAEADGGITFKLLIQTRVSEHEYEEILDAFLAFLADYHAHTLKGEIVQDLKAAKVVGRTLLLAFNGNKKVIEFIDPIPKSA